MMPRRDKSVGGDESRIVRNVGKVAMNVCEYNYRNGRRMRLNFPRLPPKSQFNERLKMQMSDKERIVDDGNGE